MKEESLFFLWVGSLLAFGQKTILCGCQSARHMRELCFDNQSQLIATFNFFFPSESYSRHLARLITRFVISVKIDGSFLKKMFWGVFRSQTKPAISAIALFNPADPIACKCVSTFIDWKRDHVTPPCYVASSALLEMECFEAAKVAAPPVALLMLKVRRSLRVEDLKVDSQVMCECCSLGVPLDSRLQMSYFDSTQQF